MKTEHQHTSGEANVSLPQVLNMFEAFRQSPVGYPYDLDNANCETSMRVELLDVLNDSRYNLVDWLYIIQSSILEKIENYKKLGFPYEREVKTLADVSLFFSRLLYNGETVRTWLNEQVELKYFLEKCSMEGE